MRTLLAGLGLAAFVVGMAPGSASAAALPRPGTSGKVKQGLFAKAISFINVNRVYCGINNIGQVCVDSAGRGTVQGGYWPRGTNDNYVFNSGLQVAGVVQGTRATNPWAGDTTGGWFFDGNGGRQQTEGVTAVYQASNPSDVANWPSDAYVPQGDSAASVYDPALQGLLSASQGDVHFIAWEGNPNFSNSRIHPLGILVDYRLLAWNYPAGAQDIIFLVATVYNITSANAADYAQHRCAPDVNATGTPCIRDLLLQQGQKFQATNNAKFNITLPTGGYTIGPMYMAYAGDNDVGDANDDYNGAILPFAMGYTYEGHFDKGTAGWTFDPNIFSAPFFAGVGFVGFKYLKGPEGPGQIQLMTTFCNGNCGGTTGHSDPGNTVINYRLLAGTPAATDGQCNVAGVPAQTHFCFMLFGTTGADTRMAESSTALTLAPGAARTIVIALIFAPPVAIPGFVANNGVNTDPGNPTWSNSSDSIIKYNGLNRVDSLTGFQHYNGPNLNGDGSTHVPVQTDFTVVRGSLLGKAVVAQSIFDLKFLQPFAPDAPAFFLIPGDRQVTVLWKPSTTETTGDPYYAFVSQPTSVGPGGTQIANALYDPNYRKFDVEGYRIYRGRSDTPSALRLLVQYDYAGTKFNDYTGIVENGNCAPELGVATDCPKAFPTTITPVPTGLSGPIAPLQPYTVFQAYNIGPQTDSIQQAPIGSPLRFIDLGTPNSRIALAGGTTSFSTVIDTVISGGGSGFPALSDTGVPFIFIDQAGVVGCPACGPVNGVTYYYSVTAFDVNAPGHGPTSLESAKVTKQAMPNAAPGNYDNSATVQSGTFGRKGLLTDMTVPTIDPTTGEFSKQMPAANGTTVKLAGFATNALKGASAVSVTFDSTLTTAISKGNDYYSLTNSNGVVTHVTIPFDISALTFAGPSFSSTFVGISVDSALTTPFGGGAGYTIAASYTVTRTGYYSTGLPNRGCANNSSSAVVAPPPAGGSYTACYFNGPRWFSGANESTPNPTTASPVIQATGSVIFDPTVTYGNAGSLPGVVAVNQPDAYGYFVGTQWRDMQAAIAPFIAMSDYKLYWGAAGKIDSVIDVSNDEPIPFNATMRNSWGVLNQAASNVAGSYDGRPELSASDFGCVAGIQQYSGGITGCSTVVPLANTAVPGPMFYTNDSTPNFKLPAKSVLAANNGFGLYLKGRLFTFELTGGAVPAAGTVWTMRDYVGMIFGGIGPKANLGKYAFDPAPVRPFTTPGVSAKLSFTVNNALVATTSAALANVHTVPDPYYVTSAFDISVDSKQIQFINVPTDATIRIYTTSGILIRVLQNTTTTNNGTVIWDVRNRTNQFVASGVYFYNVEAGGVSHSGRMTIVNYASTVQ
jgi:hypothetical protein